MARVSTYPLGALPATVYGIVGGASRRLLLGTIAAQAANSVAITGGTIAGVSVTGGSVNGTPIGGITPAAGGFSTVTANTEVHVLRTGVLTSYLRTTNAANVSVFGSGGGNFTEIANLSNGSVDIYAGGALRARVASDGKVGIGTGVATELLDINSNTLRLRTARTPASAIAAGTQGSICWDATHLYICTGTNVWRRVAHATW